MTVMSDIAECDTPCPLAKPIPVIGFGIRVDTVGFGSMMEGISDKVPPTSGYA